MPIYKDSETFYAIMGELFGQVLARPDVLQPLVEAGVVLHVTTTGPDAIIVLDTRSIPPRFIPGAPADTPADLRLRLPADLLHEVWMGRLGLREAYMGGSVRLDSNPLRALALLNSVMGVFRFVEGIYAGVLRGQGVVTEAVSRQAT